MRVKRALGYCMQGRVCSVDRVRGDGSGKRLEGGKVDGHG